MIRTGFTLACASLLTGLPAAFAGALPGPSLESIGVLPGGSYSFAYRVSGDGSRVVGHSQHISGEQRAVYYENGGLTELGTPIGLSRSNSTGVSNSGQWIVGTSSALGWRWSANTGFTSLGTVEPTGISKDGQVVVGLAGRWTAATGWQAIPGLGFPSAITPDAATIVGGTTGVGAIRWTSAGAQVIAPGSSNIAIDVTPDGRTAVGRHLVSGLNRAFRWTESGGIADLGVLPNQRTGLATGTSADGGVIVGNATVTSSTSGQAFPVPWIWTQPTGMVSLRTFLFQQGVDVSGWSLYEVYDISDDGRTITGYGINIDSQFVGWVAHVPTLPSPGTGAALALGAAVIGRRRRRSLLTH